MTMGNRGDGDGGDEKFNKAPCFECGQTGRHAPGCMQAIIGEPVLPFEDAAALEGLSFKRGADGQRPKYLSMRSPMTSIEVAFRHVILLSTTHYDGRALRYEQDGPGTSVRKLLPKGHEIAMQAVVDVDYFKADRLEGPMLIESNISVVSIRAGDKIEEWKDAPPLWAARHRSFVDIRTVPKGAELSVLVRLRTQLVVEDLEMALVGRAVRKIAG